MLTPDEPFAGELVLGIGRQRELLGCGVRGLDHGCPPTGAQQLVDIGAELRAHAVVLVTFVEEAQLVPTASDLDHLEELRRGCADEGIALLDHILVSDHRWRSVQELSVPRSSR